MPKPRVILAGCGALTGVGLGVPSLREALLKNRSGLRASERFDGSRFQSRIVGEIQSNGAGSRGDDPAFDLANAALQEARREAAAELESIDPVRVGLVLSTTKANIEALERITDGRACSDGARRHLEGNLLAADLAAEHGAAGPVQCVSVACVSGLLALQQGARLIERGAADAVLVAGVDHLSAFVVAGFSALRALDPEGCRPFDQHRCGLSPGEAGAAIVLVRSNGEDRSPVSICGWGSTNDANHMTGPSRDGSGLASAIQAALSRAGLEPDQISYINAHGTGTPYNDAMESMALKTIFGSNCPPVSGSKGMLGHTLGAAGVVESVICREAMRNKILPGTPGLKVAMEGAPDSLVHQPKTDAELPYVLKINTGFGGVNAAMVFANG